MDRFWINITNDCNLTCKYCYQNLKNTNQLTKQTSDKIIEIISNYKEDKMINFFGGEPFLNFEIMKYIVNKLKLNTCKKIYYSVTTNLTILNDDILDFIIENKINLSISIDGDEKTFRLNRLNKNNNINYFNIVKNNLEKLVNRNYKKISFLKVITANNYEYLFDDMIFLVKFNTNIVFNFDQNIANWNDNQINIDTFKTQLEKCLYYYLETKNDKIKFFYDLMNEFKLLFSASTNINAKEYCTNFKNMILSFDTEGKTFPCHIIHEIHTEENENFKEKNLNALINNISQNNILSELSNYEINDYITNIIKTKQCDICDYNFNCILQSNLSIKNMCFYSRYRYRMNLYNKRVDKEKVFCFKKYIFDLYFKAIKEGRLNINDII